MTRLTHTLALVGLLCGILFPGPFRAAARDTSPGFLSAKRLEAVKRWDPSGGRRNRDGGMRRDTDHAAPRVKNITFTNPKASGMDPTCRASPPNAPFPEFYVDGTTLPFVYFDVGPSWSGLLPISPAENEARKVR
jgi:carboxypeptidase D